MLSRRSCLIAGLPGWLWSQNAHQHHPPRSAEEYAKVLNDPKRDSWQMPHEVVTAMRLRNDEVIADIGAGTGYFSRRFANHAGKVIAVDIDPKLLEVTAKDAPANHESLLAAADDPRLPAGSVDTVFFCDVIHHIHDRNRYYPKVVAALKPGGRVVVIDFHRRPTPVGPPLEMKLSEEQMIAEWKAAGMKLVRTETFLPHQYFLFFERQ